MSSSSSDVFPREVRIVDETLSHSATVAHKKEFRSVKLELELFAEGSEENGIDKTIELCLHPFSHGAFREIETLNLTYQVFDVMSDRDTFEIFRGWNQNIVPLPHVIGLQKCSWVDTGQEQNLPGDFNLTLIDYLVVEALFKNMPNWCCCPNAMVKFSENSYALDTGHHRRNTEYESGTLLMDVTTLMHKINFCQLPFDPGEFIPPTILFKLWLSTYNRPHGCEGIPSHMEIEDVIIVWRESYWVPFANPWTVVPNATKESVAINTSRHNRSIWWSDTRQSSSLMVLISGVQFWLRCPGTIPATATTFIVALVFNLDAGNSQAQDIPKRYISANSQYLGSTRWKPVMETFKHTSLIAIFKQPNNVNIITAQCVLNRFPFDPGVTLFLDTPGGMTLVVCVWDPGISTRSNMDPWFTTPQYYVSAGYVNCLFFANESDGLGISCVFLKAGRNVTLRTASSITSYFGFHSTINDLTLVLIETLRGIRRISRTKPMGLKSDVGMLFWFARVKNVLSPRENYRGPLLKMLLGFHVSIYAVEVFSNPHIVAHFCTDATFKRHLVYIFHVWYQSRNLIALLTVHEMLGAALFSWISMYNEAQLPFFMYWWGPKTPKSTGVYHFFQSLVLLILDIVLHQHMLEFENNSGYQQKFGSYCQIENFYIWQYLALASTSPYLFQPQGKVAILAHMPTLFLH